MMIFFFLKMDKANRQYILTQGPLSHTSGHFWLMAWEQNSKGIIMLNKVIEKNQVKCHQYWPFEKKEKVMHFADVGLRVEYTEKTKCLDYVVRKLRYVGIKLIL